MPPATTPVALLIGRLLRRWSFLPLGLAAQGRGPFAPIPALVQYCAEGPDGPALAFVPDTADEAVSAALLERLELGGCGFDIDRQGQLDAVTAIREFYVLLAPLGLDAERRLAASGFMPSDGAWLCRDPAFQVPVGGDAWGGEVYPAWGDIAAPPNPPWTTRRVRGFYVAGTPSGIASHHRVRGYDFVQDGVETRPVMRRRIVLVLQPTEQDWENRLEAAIPLLWS